jgi:hypothetical protein
MNKAKVISLSPSLYYNPIISIISNILNIYSQTEISTIHAIHNQFQNKPFSLSKHTKQILREGIIQINPEHANISLSSVSVAVHRLKKAGILLVYNGSYMLHSAYQDIEKVDQLVIRLDRKEGETGANLAPKEGKNE